MKRGLAVLLMCAASALGQGSNYVSSPVTLTATSQTAGPIVLTGLGTYTAGSISVTGVSLTTATLAVQVSKDGGITYNATAIEACGVVGTFTTTITVTAQGCYEFNLQGVTHVRFVTSGTFTATSISVTLTASPNGQMSRNGGAGTGGGAGAAGVITGTAAVPIYTCPAGGVPAYFASTLTANVTSSTLVGCAAYQPVTITLTQSGTPFTYVGPTNIVGGPPMTPDAGTYTTFSGTYDGTNLVVPAASTSGTANSPTKSATAITTPVTGLAPFFDATCSCLLTKNAAGKVAAPGDLAATDTGANGTTLVIAPISGTATFVNSQTFLLTPAFNSVGGAETISINGTSYNLLRSDCATQLTNAEMRAGKQVEIQFNGTVVCEVGSTFPQNIAFTRPVSDTLTCSTTATAFATTVTIPANYVGSGNEFEVRVSYQQVHSATPAVSETVYFTLGGTQTLKMTNLTTASLNYNGEYIGKFTGTAAPSGTPQTILNTILGSSISSLTPSTTIATNATIAVGFQFQGSGAGCAAGDTMQVNRVSLVQVN